MEDGANDEPAPRNGVIVLVGVLVTPGATTVPSVEAAGMAAAVALAETLLGMPGAKPTLGDEVPPGAAGAVVNWTWGTVTTVLREEVVPADVTMVDRVTVVKGIVDAPAVPDTDATAAPVVVAGIAVIGASVMVLGTLVMMPGFCPTKGAQIPAR